ncbi:MAG: metallophosphoesterase, partial [Myxococcota bacterium]
GSLLTTLQWAAYMSLGVLLLVFCMVLFRDLIWLVLTMIDGVVGWLTAGDERRRILPADPERRNMMLSTLNVGLLGAAAALKAHGVYEARRLPQVREVEVEVQGLHSGLDGFRIVQLSDIHIGPTIKRPFLERVVEVVNGLDADLVAITGDLVDGHVEHLRDHVAPIRDIRARYGTFFSTGNHEYYWDALAWVDAIEALGIAVLNNAHTLVHHGGATLLVGGVTDYKAEQLVPEHASDPHKAIAGAPASVDFKLLLAHQPPSVTKAEEAGFDLQLSGHTHGGQFYPWHIVVGLAHPFVAGLHTFGAMQIYVSRGTGYWGPPMRIGAPSEITVLRLKAQS